MNIHVCDQCKMEFHGGVGFEDPRIHKCVRDYNSPKAKAWWDRYDNERKDNQMIDSQKLEEVFVNCLFEEGESSDFYIPIEGIVNNAGFHPERLELNRDSVREWLNQLPDSFHADKGGGMSFLNACVTKDGDHWGEHPSMEQLFLLGMGLGYVTCPMPREMWKVLPGSVPYYTVDTRSNQINETPNTNVVIVDILDVYLFNGYLENVLFSQ